jgi:hypothetical protein
VSLQKNPLFLGLHSKPSSQAAGNAPQAVLHPDGQRDEEIHPLFPRLDTLENRPKVNEKF